MFIGRSYEISELNSFYEEDGCSIAVISGSIGVGKTTLLRHFCEGKRAYYFEAYETTGKHHLQMIAEKYGLDKNVVAEEVFSKITEIAKQEKILIVIDQYPNLVKGDADIDKLLYSYVTGEWKDLPVKLVLSSDAFVLLDKYVKGKKAIWKKAIKLDLEIKPFGFYDSMEFFGEATTKEAALLYGITGGIPYNLSKVNAALKRGADVREIVTMLFLDKNQSMGLNPEKVMATELRELSYYNYMLASLAKGYNRVNQISAEVDKPKDVVVPYLNALMTIGVVTKETAITEVTNRKKTRYSIVNTSTLFWYKFVVANYDLYVAGDTEKLWEIVKNGMNSFMETVFIRICSEYLQTQSQRNQLPFSVEQIGNWWVNDEEAGTSEGFDLVSLGKSDGKSATIYCQCYYSDYPIEVAQLKSLIEKTKQLRRAGDAFYLVFSKSGFNENAITISSAIKNIMLITLNEMR